MLMFLHGNGERGDAKEELDYVLIHGPLYEAWVQKKDLPFVIIAPQLPIYSMGEVSYIKGRSRDWIPERLEEGTYEYPSHYDGNDPMDGVLADMNLPNGPEGPIDGWFKLEQDLMDILDTVQSHFKTDEKRAYLSGLSYGGYGTWYIGSRHAERFAALNPVVGYGHVDLVAPLAESQKPIWVFAGGRDTAVPVKYFYSSLQKLEELGHKDVRFTIHGDQGHDTWRRIYASEDLYSWFLEHSL